MADEMTHYTGGSRVAPQAQVSDADYFGDDTRPVWSQSRPALDSDVQGTGDMLSGVHKGSNKGPRGMGSPNAVSSPLDVDSHAAIIRASGLGKKIGNPAKDQGNVQGQDQQFKRDPARPVSTGNPGDFANPHPLTATIRGETQRPTLDDYPNLSYTPMTLGELQSRLGVPDFFGSEA